MAEQNRSIRTPAALTLDEAAAWLHVHPETLRLAASRGEVPAAQKFGRWLFLAADLASRRNLSRNSVSMA